MIAAPFTKLPPLICIVCWLFDAGYELGDKLVIDGAGATAVTEKLHVFEVCPSGLVTKTVHVPGSFALLNAYESWLLDTNVGVRTYEFPCGS